MDLAPNDDEYNNIMDVISLYLSGWQGNIDHFKEAFDENAWIFYTDSEGNLRKSFLSDCFDSWSKTNWIIEPSILSVTQTGDIATVWLEFNNITKPSASFVDVHNLIKVKNTWKITNKTASHASRCR